MQITLPEALRVMCRPLHTFTPGPPALPTCA